MLYTLTHHALSLSVNAQQGGRIVEFSHNGQNALHTQEPQWGSTFWPSPQQAWGWPPPAVLDSAPYTADYTPQQLHLLSQACPSTGLQLVKNFAPKGAGFTITYRMHNHTPSPVQYAPWEITRVGGGLTFFVSANLPESQTTLTLNSAEGAYWHEYKVHSQADHLKAFVNGSTGWLANAYQGLLLLKQFSPVQAHQVAPSEAEIEIYAHGDSAQPYIEVEQQGPYTEIAPGASVDWCVHWQLHPIPSTIPVLAGSKPLLDWVQQLVSNPTV